MESIFFQITVIVVLASFLTIVFRIFKQPAILAYILTGIILGPLGLFHFESSSALTTLGQLGITLLLFMLGLELKVKDLQSIGKTAIVAGISQMVVSVFLGYALALLLGFSSTTAFYIGIALAFSSTIIIVKLLSDRRDLNSLHGKISIGILLMQDFFAILTIILLTGATPDAEFSLISQIGLVLLKLIVLFGWIAVLSKFIFPKFVHKIARSSESLFLFSLAWVFLFTAIVTSWPIEFSIEIGGFLAGLALANTAESFQIAAKLKALRDFFVTIFFVLLGLEMTFVNISSILLPAFVFSLFVLFIKPLVVMGITGLIGYKKQTSFLVGVNMSQVSEFSLIILFLGNTVGVIPENVTTMVVLVCIISFVGSAYFIQNGKRLYKQIPHDLFLFERKDAKAHGNISSNSELAGLKNHVVIIGAHQMGQSLLRALENSGEEVLLVDFNPDVMMQMKELGHTVLFGDISDLDIQERAGLDNAKLVISTIPDIDDNLLLIEGLQQTNKKARIVVMSYEVESAKQLYKAGAHYVVLPHLAGGRHLAKILIDKNHLELIEEYKAKDLSSLS